MEQWRKHENNNNSEIFNSKSWKMEDFEKIFEYYHQPEKRKKLKIVKDEKFEEGFEKEYVDDQGRIIVKESSHSSSDEEEYSFSSEYSHAEYSYSGDNLLEVLFKESSDGEYDQVPGGYSSIGKLRIEYENGVAKKIFVEKLTHNYYEGNGDDYKRKVKQEIDIIYNKENKIEKIHTKTIAETEDGKKEEKEEDYSPDSLTLEYLVEMNIY